MDRTPPAPQPVGSSRPAPASRAGAAGPRRAARLASARWRVPAAALLATVVLGLAAAACGRSAPATDPHALVQGALAQQFFDRQRKIPSDAQETQFGQQATGMLNAVYGLPTPSRWTQPLPIDVSAIKQAGGATGVQEALLAAYVLHFQALPDTQARQLIQTLAGGGGGQAPIPVVGLKAVQKAHQQQVAQQQAQAKQAQANG